MLQGLSSPDLCVSDAVSSAPGPSNIQLHVQSRLSPSAPFPSCWALRLLFMRRGTRPSWQEPCLSAVTHTLLFVPQHPGQGCLPCRSIPDVSNPELIKVFPFVNGAFSERPTFFSFNPLVQKVIKTLVGREVCWFWCSAFFSCFVPLWILVVFKSKKKKKKDFLKNNKGLPGGVWLDFV